MPPLPHEALIVFLRLPLLGRGCCCAWPVFRIDGGAAARGLFAAAGDTPLDLMALESGGYRGASTSVAHLRNQRKVDHGRPGRLAASVGRMRRLYRHTDIPRAALDGGAPKRAGPHSNSGAFQEHPLMRIRLPQAFLNRCRTCAPANRNKRPMPGDNRKNCFFQLSSPMSGASHNNAGRGPCIPRNAPNDSCDNMCGGCTPTCG